MEQNRPEQNSEDNTTSGGPVETSSVPTEHSEKRAVPVAMISSSGRNHTGVLDSDRVELLDRVCEFCKNNPEKAKIFIYVFEKITSYREAHYVPGSPFDVAKMYGDLKEAEIRKRFNEDKENQKS